MKRPIINQHDRECVRLNTTLGAFVVFHIQVLKLRRELDIKTLKILITLKTAVSRA